MARFSRANYPISDFLRWYEEGELVLQPKFQRRGVWQEDARSYLIDTVVRELPMPKIYIRRILSPTSNFYEVVDGQQRLQSILDFLVNKLLLQKKHNPFIKQDSTFAALPFPMQQNFLDYEISTEVMSDASDQEVWALFERLNTYTLTLNKQERLNAKWFGYFKQTSYQLAAEQQALDRWITLRVFNIQQIARMTEVELSSDVLVAIVKGISDITEIARVYEAYDDAFPSAEADSAKFRDGFKYIDTHLAPAVRSTRFRQRVWFYSLLTAVIDALYGIPKGSGPADIYDIDEIQSRMREIAQVLRSPAGNKRFTLLREAFTRATSHVPERRRRHGLFFNMLTLNDEDWRSYWGGIIGNLRR